MPRVTSLNVGLPKDVGWRGRRVWTGAWKEPVQGPRTVTRANIDGDGQGDLGGHGGPNRAVLVYQEQAYQYWRELLGREDLVAGRFGDNVTVDGHLDHEVCIGDRFRIGTAEFEVSQPRVTCFRVGMRNDEPRLASLMVKHGRPGFYLRVLVEGEIAAGDEMELIHRDPAGLTVATTSALLYLPDPDMSLIRMASDHPALSEGWRGSFTDMLNPSPGQNASPVDTRRWSGFRPLLVSRVERETSHVASYYLSDPEGLELPHADPGQHLAIRLATPGGSPLVRTYTLSSSTKPDQYRISVKREPGGAFSSLLHDTVAAGDLIETAAPRGSFTIRSSSGPVVLMSAGIGITPVLPMLQRLTAADPDAEVWWLHSTRTMHDHPFRSEIDEAGARATGLRVHTWVTASDSDAHEDRAFMRTAEVVHLGRMTARAIAALGIPPEAYAYVCGPQSFIDAATDALVSAGLSPDVVSSELFGSVLALNPGVMVHDITSPHQPPSPGDGPAVTFARSGLEVPWSPAYPTLLELAEACSVPTRWVCRTGVCHTCETPLLAGSVSYTEDPLTPPLPGSALICCAVPTSGVTLDL